MKAAAAAFVFLLLAAACSGGEATSRRVVAGATPGVESSAATPTPTPVSRSRATVQRTPTPAPVLTLGLAEARVKLTKLATLSRPLAMAIRKGDSNFYIAEKGGRVRAYRSGRVRSTVLDIRGEVSSGGEQGLLGLAFSPDGSKLYVNFTDTDGDTIVREYGFSGGKADTGTKRTVLKVLQPYSNHNGGDVVFGPDGYLYIGLGDGGSGGDPQNRAQNVNKVLGKMLRIDPEGTGGTTCKDPIDPELKEANYRIPADNPFVGRAGCDEIWAFGYRNPWRYTFDRVTRDMVIGDVGQNAWEEIDFQPAGSNGGENYGWRRMEGAHSYGGGTPPDGHVPPIYEYSHGGGNCSVTGGYVYHGSKIGVLRGAYVFADYCVGRLRAFVLDEGKAKNHRFLGPQVSQLTSFGEDASGELYVMSLSGGFYRIDPA